jgi:hypothetical protein
MAAVALRLRAIDDRSRKDNRMCTVSIIFADDRVRLACNRDEQLSRPIANPPQVRSFGERVAAMPIDPVSDGTWIAVNDAGVIMALLNRNTSFDRKRDNGLISRGRIIPALMHCDSAQEAASLARGLPALAYQAFRLIVVDHDTAFEAVSSETRIRVVEHGRNLPLMFTSSGLGDVLVEGPRRALFRDLFEDGAASAARQNLFHHHRWENMQHLSVQMSRRDARTVSFTTVELSDGRAVMEYQPIGAARQPLSHVVTLELKGVVHQ